MPLVITQRNPNLNYLQQVDVTPHRLVVVVRRCFEGAYWASDDTGEFCVLNSNNNKVELLKTTKASARLQETHHCNVRVFLYGISYLSHLRLEVGSPNISYSIRHSATALGVSLAQLLPSKCVSRELGCWVVRTADSFEFVVDTGTKFPCYSSGRM